MDAVPDTQVCRIYYILSRIPRMPDIIDIIFRQSKQINFIFIITNFHPRDQSPSRQWH